MSKPPTDDAVAREILEEELQRLKSQVGKPDMAKAMLTPVWSPEEDSDAELTEYAPVGDDITLWAAKTKASTHRRAPKGAFRISWSLWSKKADDVIAGGGATSMEQAREFAYRAYQAAHGYIRGADA